MCLSLFLDSSQVSPDNEKNVSFRGKQFCLSVPKQEAKSKKEKKKEKNVLSSPKLEFRTKGEKQCLQPSKVDWDPTAQCYNMRRPDDSMDPTIKWLARHLPSGRIQLYTKPGCNKTGTSISYYAIIVNSQSIKLCQPSFILKLCLNIIKVFKSRNTIPSTFTIMCLIH